MKKALSCLLLCVGFCQAQNPYDPIGKKTGMLTLSKGKYIEYHPYDSLLQVGSVIINIKRTTISAFMEPDTTRVSADIVSRWWAVDPMAHKYPGHSPYNFAMNNPIYYIDPDGGEVEPAGGRALEAIRKTLPLSMRSYVQINPATGFLDKTLLNAHASETTSGNYGKLLKAVNATEVVKISLANTYSYKKDGVVTKKLMGKVGTITKPELATDPDYLPSTGEGTPFGEGLLGVTLVPSTETDPIYSRTGTDPNKYTITINLDLSEQGQAENVAHELYGHFDMMLKRKQDLASGGSEFSLVNPLHNYVTNPADPKAVIDANCELNTQINNATNETQQNTGEARAPETPR